MSGILNQPFRDGNLCMNARVKDGSADAGKGVRCNLQLEGAPERCPAARSLLGVGNRFPGSAV